MYASILIHTCYVLSRGKAEYGFYMPRLSTESLTSDSCFKVRNIFKIYIYDYDEETRVALKKVYQKMYQTGSGVLPWKVKITGNKSSISWSKCLQM